MLGELRLSGLYGVERVFQLAPAPERQGSRHHRIEAHARRPRVDASRVVPGGPSVVRGHGTVSWFPSRGV